MRVQRQVGGSIADLMLRVFGVVSTEEGPGALPVLAMDVLDPGGSRLFGEYGDARLEGFSGERRGETVEVWNDLAVVLNQHSRHWIDLGAEVEQGKRPQGLAP